jgi:hypothetical protein
MAVIERPLEPPVDLQKCASFAANGLWERRSRRTIAKFTWKAINLYRLSVIRSSTAGPQLRLGYAPSVWTMQRFQLLNECISSMTRPNGEIIFLTTLESLKKILICMTAHHLNAQFQGHTIPALLCQRNR